MDYVQNVLKEENNMYDVILDAIIDTIKLVPFLFVTFILLELIEHKLIKKNGKVLSKYKKVGPILGGVLGGFPQCGFSAMAANLFSGRVITMGTLVAIFLSTSDEMLPIMIGEHVDVLLIVKIILFKIIAGIIIGLLVDVIFARKDINEKNEIHHMCEEEHCHCDEDGIVFSSIKHTLMTTLYVLIANIVINLIIYYVGEETLSNLLNSGNIFVYFISSLIGLIPNCAASIIITEAYLSGVISIGVALSGLLTGSGLGILLLFKTNKSLKENLTILSIIYLVGVLLGIIVDLVI